MNGLLFSFLIFCGALRAESVVPATHTLGHTQFTLDTEGLLTVTSPYYATPLHLTLEGEAVQRLVPILNHMFAISQSNRAYMIVLPENGGFAHRHLIRFLNSNWGSRAFQGRWTERFLPQVISLRDYLYVRNHRYLIADHLFKEEGPDLILRSIDERFSVRELLEEMATTEGDPAAICANFLKGRVP